MKKIPGKIRAVLLVMVIASSGVFLAPGTASAVNYDIDDSTVVCYTDYDGARNRQTVLVVNGLYEDFGCGVFQIEEEIDDSTSDYHVLKISGRCANDDDKRHLDAACAEGTPVIDGNDWVNSVDFWKPNNCLFRESPTLATVSDRTTLDPFDGPYGEVTDCVTSFSFVD